MHFLGCLLGLVLAVFFIVFNILFRIFWGARNILKGFKGQQDAQGQYQRQQGTYGGQGTYGQQSQQSGTEQSADGGKKAHSKVFDDNEGEYVDFEEVP